MPSSWCNFYSEVFTYFGKVCVTHVKIIKMKIIQGQTSQNVKISIHRNQPESPYDHSIQCGHISMFLKKEDHFPESLLCITRSSLIALREIKQSLPTMEKGVQKSCWRHIQWTQFWKMGCVLGLTEPIHSPVNSWHAAFPMAESCRKLLCFANNM